MKPFTELGARGRRACVLFVAVGVVLFLLPGWTNAQKARTASAAQGTRKGSASAQAPTTHAGDAARGKKLFSSYGCYECHGHLGEGSIMSGPRLGPDPIPYADFVDELRHPINQMPPYTSKVVSEKDLEDIYAFLGSLPKPPKAASLPGLR